MHHRIMQVKFEFGHGPIIFDRVIPSRNLKLLFGCMYKVQIAYVSVQRNAQVKVKFGYGPWIFVRVIPLELRGKK
jgi:hypothetical protein